MLLCLKNKSVFYVFLSKKYVPYVTLSKNMFYMLLCLKICPMLLCLKFPLWIAQKKESSY